MKGHRELKAWHPGKTGMKLRCDGKAKIRDSVGLRNQGPSEKVTVGILSQLQRRKAIALAEEARGCTPRLRQTI